LGKKRFSLAEQEVALQAFQFDANLTRQYQSMDREQKEAIYKEAVGVAKANTQSILKDQFLSLAGEGGSMPSKEEKVEYATGVYSNALNSALRESLSLRLRTFN
jgi:hypothetical protein